MQAQIETSEYLHKPDTEPIPGYRILEPLGKGGFGEVWKCEAPGGLYKAMKFVAGGQNSLLDEAENGADQEFKALQHVKSIRHPFLLQMDRVEQAGNELIIVMELADQSLHDLLETFKAEGDSGIPRFDLLMYLREAAEALDLMNLEHGLAHLDVKPRNLFLVSDHVKVADFGLVNSLAELNNRKGASFQLAAFTPVYAAPESFLGKVTLHSDQYSLAVVYFELLTGQMLFDGKNFRQLAMQHVQQEPDLSLLPEGDRRFLARALAKEPDARFPSCMDFIRSLITGEMQNSTSETARAVDHRLTLLEVRVPPSLQKGTSRPTKADSMHDFHLVEQARGPQPQRPSSSHQIVPPDIVPADHEVVHSDSIVELGEEPPPSAVGPLESDSDFYVPDEEQLSGMDGVKGAPDHRKPQWPTRIEDYKYLDCIGQSALGGIWRAVTSDGRDCLLKLINVSLQDVVGFGEENPLSRLQSIQHPVLLPTTIFSRGDQGIAAVSMPVSCTLSRLLQQNPHGVQRDVVLQHLRDVAEALDALHHRYHLQHLSLNPRLSLLLEEGQVQIADYGLAELLWLPSGHPPNLINPRYSAPEFLHGQVSPHCDQYSLALIYHELLTGVHPYGAASSRSRGSGSRPLKLNLDLLPSPDRPIIEKALALESNRRFSSCSKMIESLVNGMRKPGSSSHVEVREERISDASLVTDDEPSSLATLISELEPEIIDRTIRNLVRGAAGTVEPRDYNSFGYFLCAGKYLEHQCYARLVPSTVPIKLESFKEQWGAVTVSTSEEQHVLEIRLKTSFWQRCMGQSPTLEVSIQLIPPQASGTTMTDLRLLVRPRHCNPEQAAHVLEEQSPPLLNSLRECLQVGPERRRYLRFQYNAPVQICLVNDRGEVGDPMVCQGRDISRSGMGLYLPTRPPGTHLVLQLQKSARDALISIPAKIIRVVDCPDGRLDVGVKFIKK